MARLQTCEYVDLLRRVRAEFDEMPGIRLTCDQTACLMGMDRPTCARALQDLSASGFLTTDGLTYERTYSRARSRPAE